MSRIRLLFPNIQSTLFSRSRKNKGARSTTKKDNSVDYIKHICLYNLGEYFENPINDTFEDILPENGKVISEIYDINEIYNNNFHYSSSKDVKEVAERSRSRFKILYKEYNKILKNRGKEEEEVPDEYICTLISYDILMFPVKITTDDIHTYEKDRIMAVVEKGGNWPYSKEKVTMNMITRDIDKEVQIGEYIKKLQDTVNKENKYAAGKRIHLKKRRQVKQTKQRRQVTIGKKLKKQYTKRHY